MSRRLVPQVPVPTSWSMTLIGLILILLVVGVLLWGLSRLPMVDATMKQIIYVIVVVAVALWLLSSFGEGHGFNPRLW